MLQQIVEAGFIDPELLDELSEEQKAILFYKMRQEQVRKWKLLEEKLEKDKKKKKTHSKTGLKTVSFLQGRDGNEWVWVMGEHKNDKTIEQMLEEEAIQKAERQAEKELEEIRKKEEEEIKRKLEEEQRRIEKENAEKEAELRRKEEEAALYASIKEAREAARKLEEEKKKTKEEVEFRVTNLQKRFAAERRKSIERQETQRNRRSSELYTKWKSLRDQWEKQALETSQKEEPIWKEQEKKAKAAEVEMQELARHAREEVKNSFREVRQAVNVVSAFTSGKEKPPLPPKNTDKLKAYRRKSRPPRPQNKDAIIAWFNDEERVRSAGLDPKTNKVAEWFHGIIPRMDAETMLIDESLGSFLVRVSERVWGYTISYRASDRCKHFLVDTSDDGYQFFGTNQKQHATLADLVLHHQNNPITVAGQEKLLKAIGQTGDPPDYYDLFKNRRSESTSL